jgi:hypothetical protein
MRRSRREPRAGNSNRGSVVVALLVCSCHSSGGGPAATKPGPSAGFQIVDGSARSDAAGAGARDEPDAADHSRTLPVKVLGLDLVMFERWQAPGTEHPRGTLLVGGVARNPERAVSLVEVDVLNGASLARHSLEVSVQSKVRMRRLGDFLHVVAIGPTASFWITYDLSMSEVHRTALRGLTADQLAEDGFELVVHDDHIVIANMDAIAYVFDATGVRTATRDCRPLHFNGFFGPNLSYGNGLAVLVGTTGDNERAPLHTAACAFRPDGQGPTLRGSYPVGDSIVFVNGSIYIGKEDSTAEARPGDWRRRSTFRKLGNDLRSGSPIAEPLPPIPSPPCMTTGEYVRQDETVEGVEVILTGECCGGEPGGLFLCFPGEPEVGWPPGGPSPSDR